MISLLSGASIIIDEAFRRDHQGLIAAATLPTGPFPPLHLGHFGTIWKMLAANNDNWHWIYGALGSVRCRIRGIRTERDLPRFQENVDYFRSEEALLQFIHGQVVTPPPLLSFPFL